MSVLLRRELTAAERHVDVAGLVLALETAKHDLYVEIEREQRRVARALLAGRRARIQITPRMTRILERLYQRGVDAAYQEAASMGVEIRKLFEADPVGDALPRAGTVQGWVRLRAALRLLTDRVTGVAAARIAIGADTQPQMLRAIIRVPGALSAAGSVVSKTMMSGMGDVFAANADAFGGWQHSAVLDGGTCEECDAADGTTYPTWAAAMGDMPDGGPYVNCLGGDRCRCRLVPIGAA